MRHAAARLRVLGLFIFGIVPLLAAPAGATPCAPVPDALVGWWQMEGNGADATAQHPGSVVGAGSTFPVGEVGLGYHPVANSVMVIPNHATLNPPVFTIDAWVRLESTPSSNAAVFWKGSVSGANVSSPFGLGIYGSVSNPPLALRPYLTIGNGSLGQIFNGSAQLPIGTFVHLAATADGTTLKLYLNGVLTASVPQVLTPGPSTNPVQIGGITGLSTIGFPGIIDEVELHAQAASASAINAIFLAGMAGKCPLVTLVRPATWGQMKMRYH